MFCRDITSSDSFTEMPLSAQALYFHLGLAADVSGFVTPKGTMRLINANVDDLKTLIAKQFVIPFDSGVVVITHWNMHNNIREDREAKTIYQTELKQLETKEGEYQLQEYSRSTPAQIRLDKVRLGKVSIAAVAAEKTKIQQIINYFFELKGWDNKGKDFYEKNRIIYGRFTRSAKDLIGLCDDDLEEAKLCIKKVADWAKSRDLDWSIETVFKKWYDLDQLKPKEKKPYYNGNRVFEICGKKFVLMPNGEKLQFAGSLKDIIYK